MAEPRLVVAASAEARLDRAHRWLEQRRRRGEEVLVLAASRGAADDLLRRACPAAGGLFGAHRATPLQLAAELAAHQLASRRLAPLTALGAEALAARGIALCGEAGQLEYFSPVADAPGLARALARTLRELRAHRIGGAALAAGDAAAGPDLARLLTAYEEELDRWALIDEAELLRLAGGEVERAARPPVGLPLLLLDLSPVTPAERAFLAPLLGRSPEVLATAAGGDEDGLTALAGLLGEQAHDLESDAGPATRLERLRRGVFRTDVPPPAEGENGEDESVVFLSAPGEGRECVEMARRIQHLAARGVAFDRIAILLRDPEAYLPLVEEALRRAGVPACFTRGSTRPHPAGRALLALLECAAEGLSASRFAEYLSLAQVPRPDADGAPPAVEVPWVAPQGEQLVFKTLMPAATATELDADEDDGREAADSDAPVVAGGLRTPRGWERLLVDAAVLGGEDRWRRRLGGLEAEIRLQLRAGGDEDPPAQQRLRERLEQLRHLKRFALPLIEALASLPDAAPWGEWLAALERLATMALRRPEQVLAMLAELKPMDRVGPVELDEVRRVLGERLSFLRQEPPRRRYGHVFVATVAEARGRSFDTVFLPGLAEGIFPRRAAEDPLLLDDARRQLAAALATQEQRVAAERLLLHLAAGAAAARLVVSYPNLDVLQGRPRVPSFYALDLLRAAEGRLSDLRRLESRAAAGSQSLLGWPAPRDSATAIDDAEYDLAVLGPLLRHRPGPARGSGRYLVEANEHLARALRTRYKRWRERFSDADGVIDPDAATRAAMARYRLDQRPYSPTALERFAACPYRFLLHAVHGLKPRQAPVRLEQLDPLTRGSLFHEVQHELFRALADRALVPVDEGNLYAALALLDEVLDRVAEHYREDLAPAIDRVWTSEIEELRTDLRRWVRELADAGEPWRPAHFELAFGLGCRAPSEPSSDEPPEPLGAASVLGGKLLRGAIDLVEVHPERGTLRVTDHKTGAAPRQQQLVVGGGERLQPLLYALAAEHHLGRAAEQGRLYYCTRRGRYQQVQVPVNDDTRRVIQLVLERIDRAIAEGFLPAAPRQHACTVCDYRSVCGPDEERRLRRKHPRRLLPLTHLRGVT